MTLIGVAKEAETEQRVALSPETAKKFIRLNCQIRMETGAGLKSDFPDEDYAAAGVKIVPDAKAALAEADIALCINRPDPQKTALLKPGCILVANLGATDAPDEIAKLAGANITSFAMEFMPRITRAQSMDVLSSQSNLAGYKAVIDAAAHFNRAMPMMMTAAGTVPPAKVFIMGAGVAGLQAIATARRLGAVVSATDVRMAAKEQVESLAAKFIMVEPDGDDSGETAGGYAREMSEDYKKRQAALIADHIKLQDVVITTALIPGRPAPELISAAMVESMKPGSIIVDLAAERGGNCALTSPGEIIRHGAVTIMGKTNLAGELAGNASSLFARNLYAFVELMIDPESGAIKIDRDDEIIAKTIVTDGGKIVHEALATA